MVGCLDSTPSPKSRRLAGRLHAPALQTQHSTLAQPPTRTPCTHLRHHNNSDQQPPATSTAGRAVLVSSIFSMDAIGNALGGEKGKADILESVKDKVSEGLADSGGGGGAGGAGAGGAQATGEKGGVDTEKLKTAATAYAKGEGDAEAVKKAATETATDYAQSLMGGTEAKK